MFISSLLLVFWFLLPQLDSTVWLPFFLSSFFLLLSKRTSFSLSLMICSGIIFLLEGWVNIPLGMILVVFVFSVIFEYLISSLLQRFFKYTSLYISYVMHLSLFLFFSDLLFYGVFTQNITVNYLVYAVLPMLSFVFSSNQVSDKKYAF